MPGPEEFPPEHDPLAEKFFREAPSAFFDRKTGEAHRLLYPGLTEAEYAEILKRTTALRWNPAWDQDELALKTYAKN